MNSKRIVCIAAAGFGLLGAAGSALSEPVNIEAVVSPRQQIRVDFADGSKQFVLMVHREGKATGNGPLTGADVAEYGYHDVIPGQGGDPRGYLVFTSPEGNAYVRWNIRAVFVPAAEGKQAILDQGIWELVGGSGKFKGMKGAGTINLKGVSATDRKFILNGQMVPAT